MLRFLWPYLHIIPRRATSPNSGTESQPHPKRTKTHRTQRKYECTEWDIQTQTHCKKKFRTAAELEQHNGNGHETALPFRMAPGDPDLPAPATTTTLFSPILAVQSLPTASPVLVTPPCLTSVLALAVTVRSPPSPPSSHLPASSHGLSPVSALPSVNASSYTLTPSTNALSLLAVTASAPVESFRCKKGLWGSRWDYKSRRTKCDHNYTSAPEIDQHD